MKRTLSLVMSVVAGGALAAGAEAQLALPCFSTFDADTVGAEPVMGLPHCPTSLLKTLGTEADPLVRASSLGIVTQPVEFVMDPDPTASNMLVYDFAPNVTTLLRAEATVSVSELTNAIVMRTWMNSFGLVIGDIYFNESGEIRAHGDVLGSYTPGVPVRLRMYVNMLTKTYAAAVDDELNGFADDVLVTGLSFANDPGITTNVGGVGVGYNRLGEGPTTTVALDDILIMEIPAPGALALAGFAAALVARRRR